MKHGLPILVVGLGLCLGSIGCGQQSITDMNELNRTQGEALTTIITFSKMQKGVIQSQVEATFAAAEDKIERAILETALDPRTVVDDDGVARVFSQGKDGKARAIARADIITMMKNISKAKTELAKKRAEWTIIMAKWDQLLANGNQINTRTLKTSEDIKKANETAQAFALQATEVLGSLTAGLVGGFLVAP